MIATASLSSVIMLSATSFLHYCVPPVGIMAADKIMALHQVQDKHGADDALQAT